MKKGAIFDLEGTLIGLDRQHYIVNRVLEEKKIYLDISKIYKIRGFGKYNVSNNFFRALIAFDKFKLNENLLMEENLENILDNYINKLVQKDLSLAEELVKNYKDLRYKTKLEVKDKLYPKVKETLKELSSNYLLGLYTAREKQSTADLLKELDIGKFFSIVVTEEIKRNQDLNAILNTCNALGILPNESYVVGDSEIDIIDGKKAGLQTILVFAGNGSIALQKKSKPNYIVNEVYNIIKILKD